jgi:PAS domain S-box-containing protein
MRGASRVAEVGMPERGVDRRQFDLLVDALTGYAIYALDLDGHILSWNAGAAALKGYSAEEIIGESFARFFTLEDRRAGLPDRLLAEALASGKVESEGWRVRKDGSRFWALATLQVVRDPHGEVLGLAKITRDLSAQREANQALIESERRFRYLVEGVVDYAIYMLDANGVVTNWNRGAERIKGYRSEEIIGRHFSTFYTPQERAAGLPARALATAIKEGRFAGEGWRIRKDGSRFWASVVVDPIYDDEGRHIGFAKVTRDASERKAAEEALASSERHFRLLVNGVTDYALFMLDPNGIVTNWNSGAARIKGYQADEIVGQHFSKFYTPEDRSAGLPQQFLQRALEEGRSEAEGWRVRKDGTRFWANVIIDPIRDENGTLVGYAKITRDITDKRDAQAALQKAHEQVAQSQKMEALGQLTGGVAHDFNNLLMVVSGSAQLLRPRLGDDAKALRALDRIEAAAKRGERLTQHLLTFARRQRLQTSVASLSERLGGIQELIAASLPPSIEFTVEFPPELWPVEVDQAEFDLALLNLAVNARDAMPQGGSLSITAENVVMDGVEAIAIHVGDTGVGIPPDIQARIFEPFFTTKDVNRGTGLGLSQVYGFARQAGGDIAVESELGQGTRFTLHLPRSHSTATAPVQPVEIGSTTPASILIVEDNPDVADIAAGLLEGLGHRVRVVGNATAALAALQEGDPPELVFSDVVMAGELDGVGLARLLRERHPSLPVLLATGYSQTAENLGVEFPILRKPYSLGELERAATSLLAKSRASDGKIVELSVKRRARAKTPVKRNE